VYRILVTVVIALFIASRFFVVGVLLAGWALVAMAVLPIVRGLRHLTGSPRLRRHRRRAVAVTLGATAGLAALLVAVPMPYHSHAEGVIWLSEQAMVRAGANGFVDRLLVEPGTRVTEGEPLVRSFDPMLDAKLRLAQARVAELEAQYASEFVADRAKAEIAREKLESERAALALASEKASDLIVHARSDACSSRRRRSTCPAAIIARANCWVTSSARSSRLPAWWCRRRRSTWCASRPTVSACASSIGPR